ELTCTPRVGFHRYTFAKAGKGNVIVDPTHHIYETVEKTEINMISDTEIQGYKQSNGAGGNRKVYFYAKFSKSFATYGIAAGDSILQDKDRRTGQRIRAYGSFDVTPGESIEVKVALSFISYEGARKNFDA